MHKYFIALLVLFLALGCGRERGNFKSTTKLKNILKNEKFKETYYEFRLNNIFLTTFIDTTRSFKKFAEETSFEELVSLTECEKPVDRCFAFKALVAKDYPEIRKILFRHKHDEESIKEYSDCIELNRPVKDYMLSQLEPFANSKYRFNKTEYEKIRKEFWAK